MDFGPGTIGGGVSEQVVTIEQVLINLKYNEYLAYKFKKSIG